MSVSDELAKVRKEVEQLREQEELARLRAEAVDLRKRAWSRMTDSERDKYSVVDEMYSHWASSATDRMLMTQASCPNHPMARLACRVELRRRGMLALDSTIERDLELVEEKRAKEAEAEGRRPVVVVVNGGGSRPGKFWDGCFAE